MPQFVLAAAAFAASAGASAFITGAIFVGGMALSYSQSQKEKRRARDEFNAAQVDRLANINSTVAPRDLVLGRVRKGGPVFFRGSTGANKGTFVMCIAIAGHEIDAVEGIYLNDVAVTLDVDGNVLDAPYQLSTTLSQTDTGGVLTQTPIPGTARYWTGTTSGPSGDLVEVTSGDAWTTATYQYAQPSYQANIRWVLGTDDQVADAELQTLFPGVWTSAHRARGVAYLIARFEYNEVAFPTGLPTVTALVRGAKCYDPRTGLTVWTRNPAILMRHVYQHASFGKATVSAEEDARISIAADACDASTNFVVGGTTTTRALYRAALVVPFGAPARDVFDDLAQAMAGSWAFAGGQIYMKAGVFTSSVMSLTEADLAVIERDGAAETMIPIEIAVHKERVEKFNTVNVQIWDLEQDYKQVSLTPLTSAALVTRDGATLAQAVTYAAIGYAPQALHVAGVMMRDARDPLTVVVPFKLRAYPLELFDTVDLTIARYGWSGKLFTILKREWHSDGKILLTLKETAASIYTLDAEFSAQGGAANTILPNPWYLTPVGTLTVTSGTDELVRQTDGTVVSRMRVAWPAIDDSSVTQGGTVEIQYRAVLSDGEWSSITIDGAQNQVVISGVEDSNYYTIRARVRNRLTVSMWSTQVTHQVVGKTEAPSDVSSIAINGLVLSWPAVTDIDLAGYRLRAIAGATSNWSGGFALHDGIITDPPYTLSAALSGLYTYMVVAVDTSGNESDTPASVTASATYSLAGNTLEAWPQAPLFEGAITGGTVSGGELLADSTGTLFWGADSNLHWISDSATYWGLSSYGEMVYTFSVGASAAGLLVLDSEIDGEVVTIEMRRSGVGDFWTSDAATFWISDPAAFWVAAAGAWSPWPGSLTVAAGEYIEWRVTTSAGITQGRIATLTPYLDVPTVEDYIDNAVVADTGTRLTLAKTFRAVRNIQLTVQQDGGTAVTARWIDKDPTGPLVQALDITGTPVPATVDAYLKGY